MKKIILSSLVILMVMVSVNANAKSKNITTELGNNLITEVQLPKNDLNNVMITIKRNDGAILGALVLSPEQPTLENLTYRLGKQKIHIQNIQLGLPQYERAMGSVVINCKTYNWAGKHKRKYKGVIASWAY